MGRRRKLLAAALIVGVMGVPGVQVVHADDVPPILSPLDSTGIKHAVRMDPPKPPPIPVLWTTESANGRCVGMIAALTYWSPGWDVNRMAGIAQRESECVPSASNSCCSGIFQVHRIWIPKAAMCGVYSCDDLYDPWKNICVAAIIYRDQGMSAWSQTL